MSSVTGQRNLNVDKITSDVTVSDQKLVSFCYNVIIVLLFVFDSCLKVVYYEEMKGDLKRIQVYI